eukprot:1153035-Pelagomonas_calceolata.AAC.2
MQQTFAHKRSQECASTMTSTTRDRKKRKHHKPYNWGKARTCPSGTAGLTIPSGNQEQPFAFGLQIKSSSSTSHSSGNASWQKRGRNAESPNEETAGGTHSRVVASAPAGEVMQKNPGSALWKAATACSTSQGPRGP